MKNDNNTLRPKEPVWKTVFKWVLCLLLLAYVGAALAIVPSLKGDMTCTGLDLRVEGTTLPDSIIRNGVTSQIANYKGQVLGARIADIDLQGIEDYLSRFSNFENVECSIDPERRLRICVSPIQPEVRVFEPSGKSYYVNRAGKRIKANADFYVDVPVLILGQNAGVPPEYALPVIRRVAADPELGALISGFKLDGRTDILLLPSLHGHVVNFGDTTGFERKKAALMTAYRKILPAKGWETYDTISVKFRDQIVASRRNKAVATHGPTEETGMDLEEATLLTELDNQPSGQENG